MGNVKTTVDVKTVLKLPAAMLVAMCGLPIVVALAQRGSLAYGQSLTTVPVFDVASVKASQHPVGPDYNNQITYSANGMTGRNITLRRLLAEAYHLQQNLVLGPNWLDQNEYEVDARAAGPVTREQMDLMLRGLVADRFKLAQHSEEREMRVNELVVGSAGAKIHPVDGGEAVKAGGGFHFHGDMRQFADLLAVQLSIPAAENPNEPVRASGAPTPVVDKTGLAGVFDFSEEMRPELGTDMFAAWQRVLQEQLGLRIESRKGKVGVLVVDDAVKIPTEN
jgi:uncharacterized protein (TIGR03435 family)